MLQGIKIYSRWTQKEVASLPLVKTTAHVHNYEHEQVPMVTDLHMRPVMGFLYLGTEARGVYMRTLEAEIRHPHLATG